MTGYRGTGSRDRVKTFFGLWSVFVPPSSLGPVGICIVPKRCLPKQRFTSNTNSARPMDRDKIQGENLRCSATAAVPAMNASSHAAHPASIAMQGTNSSSYASPPASIALSGTAACCSQRGSSLVCGTR